MWRQHITFIRPFGAGRQEEPPLRKGRTAVGIVRRYLLLMAIGTNVIVLQTGCISRLLAPEVMSYNLALERAQNEMLLLNIARAAKFKPLYLVDVSKVTGSLKSDMSAKVGAGFDGGPAYVAAANNLASLSGTYTVNPTFDVNLLNGADFTKGFVQPITGERLALLFARGWRPELLLHLFVSEVEFVGAGVERLRNRPDWRKPDAGKWQAFRDWVTTFCECEPRVIRIAKERERIGPALTVNGVRDLAALVSIAKEGFRLDRGTLGTNADEYQLFGKEEETFALVPSKWVGRYRSETTGTRPAGEEARTDQVAGLDCDGKKVRFLLRSPESVVYHLGSWVRFEAVQHEIPQLLIKMEGDAGGSPKYEVIPLFVGVQTNLPGEDTKDFIAGTKAWVAVMDDEGDTFMIPRERRPLTEKSRATGVWLDEKEARQRVWLPEKECVGPGMSPDVLALLGQLISLHKSAKELVGTPVVRTIGQ
jgi:hypothetical protein